MLALQAYAAVRIFQQACRSDHDDDSEVLSNNIDIIKSHSLFHFMLLFIWATCATSVSDKQIPSYLSQVCPRFSFSVLIGVVRIEQLFMISFLIMALKERLVMHSA